MRELTVLFVLVVCFVVTAASQQSVLGKYLEIQHKRLHFSGAVLVTKNNEELYHESIGSASHELNVPVTPTTKFRVASVTKQFTGMLVAIAFIEGRLNKNDSLAKFFHTIQDQQWRRITIHQLLTHSSGIPHNEGITDYWTIKSRLPLNKELAVKEIFQMKLLFDPGTAMHYSSPGYYLLAAILEQTYRRSYAELLVEKILQPLGMKHTGVLETGRIVNQMSGGYHLAGDSVVIAPHRDMSLMRGSGDMYATAEDLGRWNNSFLLRKWDTAITNELFQDYTSRSPGYGYGWFIRSDNRPAYYHGGGTFGCAALSAFYPNEKIAIIIVSNVSVLPVNEIWADIEKIVFGDPFVMPSVTEPLIMSSAALERFAGTYSLGEQRLKIVLSKGRLYAKLGNNQAFEVYAKSSSSFFGKKVNIVLDFKEDAEGSVVAVETRGRGQIHTFNKQ